VQQPIALDTLGKLHAYGYRLFGWCRDCQNKYDRRRRDNPLTHFDIDVAALAAERGADCAVVGLAPIACPRCASRDTQTRLLPPRHRSWQ
jgi:hypothetical protein